MALGLVVFRQLVAEPSCYGSHDGIEPRIEGLLFAKHLDAQQVFFHLGALSGQLPVDNKTQKPAELRRLNEDAAGEDLFELSSDCAGRKLLVRIAIAAVEQHF